MSDTLSDIDGTLRRFKASVQRREALVDRLRRERDQLISAIRKLDEASREARLLVDRIEGGGAP